MTSLQEITEDLDALNNQEERIEYLMELGEELESFPQELKTAKNKVPGCVSGVYMDVTLKDGRIHIRAMSESLIVRGFVKIFIEYFNNKKVQEVSGFEEFAQKYHLTKSVVATRANAIGSMLAFLEKKIIQQP